MHYSGVCLAAIPSEAEVLTRFGHALQLREAKHFTFHCGDGWKGLERRGGAGGK